MTCSYETWISAFMDGELPQQKSKAMEDHLATCPACQARYEALTGLDHLLQSLPDLKPSEHFERTFWTKVAAWEENRPRRRFVNWIGQGWRQVLASALALVVLVVFWVYQGRFSNRPSPEEIMITEQMDILQHYEIISNLEMLENWEAIAGEDGNS